MSGIEAQGEPLGVWWCNAYCQPFGYAVESELLTIEEVAVAVDAGPIVCVSWSSLDVML
jgi:hypothetical protein